MNSQREAFEKWAIKAYSYTDYSKGELLDKFDDGDYTMRSVSINWDAWQAATEQGVGEPVGGAPLPCPFCGNKPEWEYHEDPSYPQVECRNIECPIGLTNDLVSLDSWNTRSHPPKPTGDSDIADAIKWLDKYQQSYGEMYTDLGRFLDAEAEEMPPLSDEEIDSAWKTFNAAPGLVFWDRIRAAILAKPTGGGVPEGLIEFAKRMLAASRDGCGVDGADIQEWALECGLIDPYQATESCGPDCVCAEVADFPIECYRDSALLATQQPKD